MADKLTLIKNRIVGYGEKPADQFMAHPLNHRKHPQRQRAAVSAALREIGWIDDVIENVQTGNLIDGHERVWQALKAGNQPVPFKQVDLSPEEEVLALATFDAITNMAETDAAKLDELLRDVSTGEAALMELMAEMSANAGLFPDKLDDGDADPQIDRAEELRQQWGVETGQLWRLPSRTQGQEHRLICGDCTDAAVVERVMGEERADLVLTDPPYNIGYSYDTYDDNKTQDDWGDTVRLWRSLVLGLNCPAIITPGRQNTFLWGAAGDPNIGAWIKPNAHGGASIANFAKFEPILFYGKHFRRRASDVFDHYVDNGFLNDDAAVGHTCPKPLRLWDDLVANYSDAGWIIYEPFLGSGTTLIAAENLARQCRAVEISPGYVAVALQRYQDAFGITAELVE